MNRQYKSKKDTPAKRVMEYFFQINNPRRKDAESIKNIGIKTSEKEK